MIGFKRTVPQAAAPAPRPARASRPRSRPPVGLIVGLCFASVFCALLIGIGLGVVAVALLLPLALAFVLIASGSLGEMRFGGEGMLWLVFFLVMATAMVDAVLPIRTRGLVSIVLLLSAWMALRGLLQFMRISALGRAMFVLFGLFFLMGVISAIHPHPHWKAVAYQFAYDAKLPMMIALGFGVTLGEKGEQRFWICIRLLLAYCLVMCMFQLAAPGVYASVVHSTALHAKNPFIGVLPLMAGPFLHPGVLAFNCSLFLGWFMVRQEAGLGNPVGNYLTMGLCLLLLLLSGERQETFDAIITCAVLWYIRRVPYSTKAVVLGVSGAVLLGLALLFVLGVDRVTELQVQWGMLPSPHALDTPRAILYNDANYLATTRFPLGTGFGTFGGDASRMFDRSVYEMLGYDHRYWWYRQDLFLLDTYWPHLLAETGFIGAGAVLLFCLSMVTYSLRAAWMASHARARMLWQMALAGQLLAFGGSITGSLYGDPNAVALPFLFFGIAFMYAWRLRQAAAALPAAAPALPAVLPRHAAAR